MFGRVYQWLIFSIGSHPHADTWLLLVRETLSEKVTVPRFLEQVVRFYGQELANALADLLPARQMVEVLAGVLRLFRDPLTGPRGVLIFEPAIGVRDRYSMKNLSDRFNSSRR